MFTNQKHTTSKHKPTVLFTALATTFVVTSSFLFYSPSILVRAVDITNSATVSGPTQDLNTANNVASITNPITFVSDLAVTINDNLTSTTPTSNSTYTITITNNGPSSLTAANLAQTLPNQLTNPIYSSSEGTFDSSTVNLTGITLASG